MAQRLISMFIQKLYAMKKYLLSGLILFLGISTMVANPRNPPSGSNNKPPQGPSNYGNHYGHPNQGPGKPNNNNHSYHGGNNHHQDHWNHTSYHRPPSRPVIVTPPRPVIVTTPRPVIQVQVNRPQTVYTTPVNTYSFNFRDYVNTIRNQKFESDRISVARQGLYNNLFDTYQIKEVLSLLDYEESRLEFAKEAYNNCVDKQNYYRINEMFRFSSSVHELESFIFARR